MNYLYLLCRQLWFSWLWVNDCQIGSINSWSIIADDCVFLTSDHFSDLSSDCVKNKTHKPQDMSLRTWAKLTALQRLYGVIIRVQTLTICPVKGNSCLIFQFNRYFCLSICWCQFMHKLHISPLTLCVKNIY